MGRPAVYHPECSPMASRRNAGGPWVSRSWTNSGKLYSPFQFARGVRGIDRISKHFLGVSWHEAGCVFMARLVFGRVLSEGVTCDGSVFPRWRRHVCGNRMNSSYCLFSIDLVRSHSGHVRPQWLVSCQAPQETRPRSSHSSGTFCPRTRSLTRKTKR